MEITKKKRLRRIRIKRGIRKKLSGTPEKPRLSVFRSNNEIYAQLINDIEGNTLVSANSLQKEVDTKGKNKTEIAVEVGKLLAERAKEAKIETIVFDRNGYLYHGRVKALAEGVRKGGLKF